MAHVLPAAGGRTERSTLPRKIIACAGRRGRRERDSKQRRARGLPLARHAQFRLRTGLVVDQFHGAVIVAVALMRMVEMIADNVVDVIPVGDGRVAAPRAVTVAGLVAPASMRRRTGAWVALADLEPALVHVISVHGVQAAVVEVIGVILMADRGVAAALAVNMRVLRMDPVLWHGQTPVITEMPEKG